METTGRDDHGNEFAVAMKIHSHFWSESYNIFLSLSLLDVGENNQENGSHRVLTTT
jgi:hypothetical protein